MDSRPAKLPIDLASALLRRRIRALFVQLPRGLAGEQEAIHQLRVSARRLRTTLGLLARKPSGKRVRRAARVLRALTRVAGRSRDLDVGLGLLEARLQQLGTLGLEQARLRRRLRAARTRSHKRMAEALLDLEIAALRRALRRASARRADDPFTVLSRVRAERDRLGSELGLGLSALGDRFEPDTLHRLRRRARRLRYVAEISDALRGEDSAAPNLLKTLQEGIGALHDAHVLAGWLGAQGAAAEASGQGALAQEAYTLQAFFMEKARLEHRGLLEQHPVRLVLQALELMARARSAA